MRRRSSQGRRPPAASPFYSDPRPSARTACEKVRDGLGGWACRAHGRLWPCFAREQPTAQLALLEVAAPLAPPVLAEIAAERLHQLAAHPPHADDRLHARDWVGLLVDYLNRAADEGRRIGAQVDAGLEVNLEGYRRRMIQVAAIAAAAVESCDRALTIPGVPR